MAIFIIQRGGWCTSIEVVRAKTVEEAVKVAQASPFDEITLIVDDGPAQILWSFEHCPDTPREE